MKNINESIKYISNETHVLLKFVITLFLILVNILNMNINCVEARLGDNVPEYRDQDYDHQLIFRTISNAHGRYTMKCTADLSLMDELAVPNILLVQRCCANPVYDYTNFYRVAVNGVNVYYNNDFVITDDLTEGSTTQPPIDFRPFRTSNANIDVEYNVQDLYCHSCGQYANTRVIYNGLYFTDKRGKATFQKTNYQVSSGGSVTISPDYNSETHHMSWGIRKKGDSGFTLLREGVNGDGIIASNVNGRNITISNIPATGTYEVGVFVYDSDGNLPAGTSFPVTPFYVSIETVSDSEFPGLDIKKSYDTENGQVIVKLIGRDNVGLHASPYSWDGGNVFGNSDIKAFKDIGTYQVAVRDSSQNITTGTFYIDTMDIEKVRPSSVTPDKPITDKDTTTDKGHSGSGQDTGETGGINNKSDNNTPAQNIETINQQTGTLLEKANDKEYVVVKPIEQNANDTVTSAKSKDTSKQTDNSKSKADKNSKLKPKEISEKDSNDLFEKIRQNSEDYIISMKETKSESDKLSRDKNAQIELKSIDTESNGVDIVNKNEEDKIYNPKKESKSALFYILMLIAIVFIILILLYVLFFGVLIFADKETEFTALSNSGGIKMPVAISIICLKNGKWTVCFRELLEKYGMVYAKFGLVFVYLYENDRIKIMTKFRGEAKREIATEIIKREIIVGSKGGTR